MSLEPFTSSKTDEWATPPEFVRPLADAIGGFDLDPASGAEQSPVADETYTAEEDGLAHAWTGKVWCNPPYSEMEQWANKAINEFQREETELIVFLCKGDSSADWWQQCAEQADTLATVADRLEFGDGGMDAPFPSHVFVFGDLPTDALDVLAGRGVVLDSTATYDRTEQMTLTGSGGGSDGD